jgi:Immunoglobulin-like domain of bacterial spore germination
MSRRPTDLEQRVGAALHTEVDAVTPAPGSLEQIRERGRVARRRRRSLATAGAVAVVAVAVAVAVPALRDDGSNVTTRPDPAPTTTTTVPPPADVSRALWPDPDGSERYDDPAAAARSFMAAVADVEDTPLSPVRDVADGEAEVDVLDRAEDGTPRDSVASTLSLARLDGTHWFVTGAQSEDVEITSPPPGSTAGTRATVSGAGRGYEGTIVVQVRTRATGAPMVAEAVTVAGAGEELAPFSVDLALPTGASTPAPAVLVARTDSGAELGVPHLAAQSILVPGSRSADPPGGGPSTTAPPADPGEAFELAGQPLWPFRTYAEAEAWRAAAADGHQPWHADAAATASAFTTGFLGFTGIDQVTSTDVRADEAWIGVGYTAPFESGPSTSAVIHLVRFGPHADSPWEVVGTRDTVFTLDTPRYGTPVSSPTPVGGVVTGVDECIHVAVRQSSSEAPLGTAACVPAGGEAAPWSSSVAWTGATDPALTIVASTGGHVVDVEVFAITGVPG